MTSCDHSIVTTVYYVLYRHRWYRPTQSNAPFHHCFICKLRHMLSSCFLLVFPYLSLAVLLDDNTVVLPGSLSERIPFQASTRNGRERAATFRRGLGSKYEKCTMEEGLYNIKINRVHGWFFDSKYLDQAYGDMFQLWPKPYTDTYWRIEQQTPQPEKQGGEQPQYQYRMALVPNAAVDRTNPQTAVADGYLGCCVKNFRDRPCVVEAQYAQWVTFWCDKTSKPPNSQSRHRRSVYLQMAGSAYWFGIENVIESVFHSTPTTSFTFVKLFQV